VLLLGVQGCGKSSHGQGHRRRRGGVPLVRLDIGAHLQQVSSARNGGATCGESLKNRRSRWRPCVMWVRRDRERPRHLGQRTTASRARVLGALLTWMAERKHPVFLVATANDVSRLPPELLRKGRFDEIFFIDLPAADARHAIFRVHFDKRKLDHNDVDLDALVAASEGFSGAEIEQGIVAALYAAHADGVPLQQRHLVSELKATRPLSVLMAEPVQQLREWAKTRTVSAD
jgi:SpoVK/Ycf46/Vps4 family AAA+-type ATPase